MHAYRWDSAAPSVASNYLTPVIVDLCRKLNVERILDVGCGNGSLCAALAEHGFDVEGCEPSADGVAIARRTHPTIRFHRVGVEDEPPVGFDTVIAAEVIEHLYAPRLLPRFARRALTHGSNLIVTTPYHGYMKNLALSVVGAWDTHHSPLWDGGHIKFWSRATLEQLMAEEGFSVTDFRGVGRMPYLWKSMVVVAHL